MRGALARVWIAVLVTAGCASSDPLGRVDALRATQKQYTDMVRWGDVEQAQKFVDPAMREEFVRLAASFEGLRITDAEIGEFEHEEMTARVTVTYRGYALANLVEKEAREQQEWYRDEGLANVWHVRPGLDAVVTALGGRPPVAANPPASAPAKVAP
jgi:hypothetical protein